MGVCPGECIDNFLQADCMALDAAAGGNVWFFSTGGICNFNDACLGLPRPENCCKGDVNEDDEVNGGDVASFVDMVVSGVICGFDPNMLFSRSFCNADMNRDGFLTAGDTTGFVDALLAGEECPAAFDCACGAPQPDVDENEPCGSEINLGCNDPLNPIYESFGANDPCQAGGISFCGTAWADGGMRDTDWWGPFVLFSAMDVSISVNSDTLPVGAFLVNVTDCNNAFVPGSVALAASCNAGAATNTFASGSYAIFVGTADANGAIFDGFPCGGDRAYTVTVSCVPAPTGACCDSNSTCIGTMPEFDCSNMGPSFVWHAGEDCSVFQCPAAPQVIWDQGGMQDNSGSAAQDFEPANDAFDVWVVSDFQTTQPWNLGTVIYDSFNFPGGSSAFSTGTSARVFNGLPWAGGVAVATSVSGIDETDTNGTATADFGGAMLPAGSYYMVFTIQRSFATGGQVAVANTFNAGAVPAGFEENDFQWNPGGGFALPGPGGSGPVSSFCPTPPMGCFSMPQDVAWILRSP